MLAAFLRRWRMRNAPWIKPDTVWFNDRHCAELESCLDRVAGSPKNPVTYFRDRITGQLWAYQTVEAGPVDVMGYVPIVAPYPGDVLKTD
jgi:hypothetical protein